MVGKEIRFRMPLVRVETVADFDPAVPVEEKFRDHVSLTCECRIVMVAPRPVGFLRGWRYLADKDAPPDLVMPAAGDPPPEMARELREMGLG